MLKFQNRVALITGSGTGIGQAIAKKFAENGASVIILGRRKEPLETTAKILEEIIKKSQSNGFVKIFDGVDVSDEEGITNMFDEIKKSNIVVDFVVNNAGVSGPVTCFSHAALDDFKSTVAIHLTGTFWTSSQALRVMKEGGKIITISTFFSEERPFEQRPYRFRGPYTASQGAKNRLAEEMSWELTEKGIISIATNPGPVHSDRIYKTVYPKAAAEFLRVSGFEDLPPKEVDVANKLVIELLGEDDNIVKDGIKKAAEKMSSQTGRDGKKLEQTLTNLLNKIQTIAEKVQTNTSKMIADEQFLSQEQVAETVLTLCDDNIGKILNGKVIPGDRVFYPVKPHIMTFVANSKPDFNQKVVVFTIDATDENDISRVESLAQHVEQNGGKAVCLISNSIPEKLHASLSKFHSHIVDLKNPSEVKRWFDAAKKVGNVSLVVHITGRVPDHDKFLELSRKEWDGLVDKFVNTPATILQGALELYVPGGNDDPRLYKDTTGRIIVIGPDLPVGNKIPGTERAKVEVFRGALRPFTTTINQELSDVLKTKIRSFLVLAGSVDGTDPSIERIKELTNYLTSESSNDASEVIYYVDEKR